MFTPPFPWQKSIYTFSLSSLFIPSSKLVNGISLHNQSCKLTLIWQCHSNLENNSRVFTLTFRVEGGIGMSVHRTCHFSVRLTSALCKCPAPFWVCAAYLHLSYYRREFERKTLGWKQEVNERLNFEESIFHFLSLLKRKCYLPKCIFQIQEICLIKRKRTIIEWNFLSSSISASTNIMAKPEFNQTSCHWQTSSVNLIRTSKEFSVLRSELQMSILTF